MTPVTTSTTSSPNSSPNNLMPALLRDRRLLIYLFISFRLLLIIVHSPIKDYTPGLPAFGDFSYFYDLAKTSDQGKLPFRDYWFEYPPVIAIVSQSVYGLISGRGGDYTAYAVLLAMVLTAFDIGNLILLSRIGSRLHGPGTGTALGWIYALMVAPLIVSYWTFDSIVAFFMLLSVAWLLEERHTLSAGAAALGALTKLFPLAIVGAVWRYRQAKVALRYSLIAIGLTVVGFAAMLIFAGRFGLPSLAIQFNKSSSETVWALIDGNYKTGIVNPDHFDPATAMQLQGNPARIPSWLRTALFAALGLAIYATTRRFDNKGLVAFIGITVLIFYLWSQSWSPQWQVLIIPLILINFPTRNGVIGCLFLQFMSFVEYPLLLTRNGGEVAPAMLPMFALLVLLRTGLFIGLAVALYRRLRVELPTTPFVSTPVSEA